MKPETIRRKIKELGAEIEEAEHMAAIASGPFTEEFELKRLYKLQWQQYRLEQLLMERSGGR